MKDGEELSLADALSDGFDELAAAAEEEKEPEITDEEVEVPEEEVTEEPETDEPEAETVAEAQDETEEAPVVDPTEEEAIYNEPAPERWPEEIRQAYNSLPPEGKKAMLEGIYKPMQRHYTESTMQVSEAQKQLHPMLETMNQHRPEFERLGVNPVEAFNRQMQWAAHFARVGPQQGIQDMAQAFGLKDEAGQASDEDSYLTPLERKLKSEVTEIRSLLNEQNQTQQMATEQAQEAAKKDRLADIQKNLSDFHNESKDGQRLHPHMEKVGQNMVKLINNGMVEGFDEFGRPLPLRSVIGQAYKMACNLDPTIRSASPKRRGQVAQVKAASDVGVVTKRPAGRSTVETPAVPLDVELSETYDKLARRTG